MTTRWYGLCLVLLIPAVAYWLFADTVRHWRPGESPGNELRFSYWGGFDDHQMWQEVLQAFNSRRPDVRVSPEWLPLSGYTAKIAQELVAGDAPDVMMTQDEPFPRYARDQFASLDDLLRDDPAAQKDLDDCWPTATSSFQFAGSLRGVPLMGGNVLIYCNQLAFDRASRFHGRPVPLPSHDWTLDDFLDTCRLLTIDADGDGRTDQFGFMQPHWVYYLPFIWANGAELTDPARSKWTLQGPQALAALAMYGDLRHRWRVTPTCPASSQDRTLTPLFSPAAWPCASTGRGSNRSCARPLWRGTIASCRFLVDPAAGPRGSLGTACACIRK